VTEHPSRASKAELLIELRERIIGSSSATPLSLSGLLTIAIPKGRMQDEALALFARAGIRTEDDPLSTRRLISEDESGKYRFIFVKPSDVPTYVEHGIADCGVVGQDVLLERESDVLLPLDLQIANCQIVVASNRPDVLTNDPGVLRVATKYPEIARKYFGARGISVEIIGLSGSVELAPVLGLANCIVDLVETGRTLRENGLAVVETIAGSSGRLVVNRASYQLKADGILRLVSILAQLVNRNRE
jgi:ATP phosphoribosyltransferase